MVVNNLLIKLKVRDKESIEKAKNTLLSMKGRIPVLLDIQVKTDVKGVDAAYSLMLITKFNSTADLKTYLDHPVHLEVAGYITGVMEHGASLCYEL
jgi:hypothetical protein